MLIRNANITEGYEIEALVKLCAEDSEGMMITSEEANGISQHILRGQTMSMIIEVDNVIVGVVTGTMGVVQSTAHNLELAMCIHPAFRGGGFGTELLRTFVNEYSYMNLFADVSESNSVIIKLLQGLNFKEVGRVPKAIKEKSGYKDKLILFYYG